MISILWLLFPTRVGTRDYVQVKTINGVVHILNSSKPLQGTIQLEVERTRTIDPYEQPEVGMRGISFARKPDGEVILFDASNAEGHRWSSRGQYLGPLTRKGQGPGEFVSNIGYYPCFIGPEIWVRGGMKAARFDKDGKFIKERAFRNRIDSFIDDRHGLALESTPGPKAMRTLRLVEFDFDNPEGDKIFGLIGPAEVGAIQKPSGRGGFIDPWGTPNIVSTCIPSLGQIFMAFNTEYKIQVKDFEGNLQMVIEKPHKNIKVTKKDLETMYGSLLKQEFMKWLWDAYPGHFVAIMKLVSLPRGHLGVYRVTGPQAVEIDVFDPKGRFLYILIPPPGILIGEAQFFESGFAVVEQEADKYVYHEYRIKNLPFLFGK
jgi:hypothetical protein